MSNSVESTEQMFELRTAVATCLAEHPGVRFTARQLAHLIIETFPAECADKLRRSRRVTNTDQLVNQIACEIYSKTATLRRSNPRVKIVHSRPRTYYWG